MIANAIGENQALYLRNMTIKWLTQNGYPALPVAPKQDSFKYPKRDKNGNIEYEEDGKTPKPKFTGKNPSYLDENNEPHLVFHSKYQNILPTQNELDRWFANPLNGVGTLGGWNETIWIDFDVKNFDSPEECDRTVLEWLERYPALKGTFIERTHSGGWRIGTQVRKKPKFTNFALSPGGKHLGECLGSGRFTVLSPTIGPSGNAYKSINRGELVEVEDLESIGLYSTKKQASTNLPSSLTQLDLAPHAIPLEELLSEKVREILNGGNPTGDRSEALTTLAKEAFGWQNWCFENGISISGDAENLVELAGKKLGIDSDRIQRILKTIDSSSCQPSAQYLGGEESCWQKIRRLDKGTFDAKCPAAIKLEIENNLKASLNIPQLPKQVVAETENARHTLSTTLLEAELEKLIQEDLPQSELTDAIENLAIKSGRQTHKLWALYHARIKELEENEERSDVKKALPSLLDCQKARLNPYDLFRGDNGNLAESLTTVAKAMPTSTEAVINTLIAVTASRIGTSSRIIIDPKSGYTQTCIFWSCNIAPSGSKKTPSQRIVIDPLEELEAEEFRKFKQESDNYQYALRQHKSKKGDSVDLPEPPAPRGRYLVQNSTTEARMRIHSENPRGLLYYRDEWSGFFNGRNKYRGGKGDDAELDLSEFNGKSLSKDTVKEEGAVYLPKSAISRTGSTQPLTLQKLMANHEDHTGEFARWLFIIVSCPPAYINLFADEDNSGAKLAEYLTKIYKILGNLPDRDYLLTIGAKAVFQAYQHQLVDWTKQETHPGLQTAYPKFETYLARFALWLHLINSVLAGEITPSAFIEGETMEIACAIVDFYIAQLKLIYTYNSPQLELAGNLLKIKEFVERKPGSQIREIKSGISAFRKIPSDKLRKDCQTLVEGGIIKLINKNYYPAS
ncbi:MAG: DUF3987 domain-containing protein [Aulosira sp. ZfuVER01]|nr:DUF3987 domain-containing protein [Aulosira sp. ZfuVER01]MDZ8001697.1 DUF3987 domain-containing protein [Aulosira sp. DedVER01a]MDZ8055201.1 DUF3987 domain-containing protein [Aulosira sp. ZfuCHP01]